MNTERRSRNRIVLVLVIELRHPIEDEDENEDDEEKFARRAKILRDSSRDSWLILSTTRSPCREYFRVSSATHPPGSLLRRTGPVAPRPPACEFHFQPPEFSTLQYSRAGAPASPPAAPSSPDRL